MRTIEIDYDIHRLIQLERRDFDEPEYVALRRLLKLAPPTDEARAASDRNRLRGWSKGGLTLPHGTELRMEYNGVLHLGRIADGAWEVEGHRTSSPSGAASAVARTRDGDPVNINGKAYWQVRRPGDTDWIPYADLKRRK
jgi:hypothetical protein